MSRGREVASGRGGGSQGTKGTVRTCSERWCSEALATLHRMRCFGHVASRAVSALRALAASVFSDSPGDANAPKGGLMTTPRLDRDAARAALLEQLPAFVRAYAAPDTPVRELRGEIRVGRKGSLSIVRANGVFFDHESGCGGDVFELACKPHRGAGLP